MTWKQIGESTNGNKITWLRWMIVAMQIALVAVVGLIWVLPYADFWGPFDVAVEGWSWKT